MATTTVYDIKLRMLLDNRVAKGANEVDAALKRAAKSSGLLSQGISKLAVSVGALYTGHALKRSLIDYNAYLEQAKITMAGMIKLNTGESFASSMEKANKITAEFVDIAKVSIGTTKDFVFMASMLTRPIMAAGMSMEDLRDITKGAVIASQAFGIQSEVAALDIEQALMGTLTKRDRFTRALIEPLGWTTEAFNKLDAAQRATVLKGVLTQPAIDQMAKAQEKSFAGVSSTFQDNLEILLGKVGLPLFQSLTEELQNWNKWLDANKDTVAGIVDTFSKGLVHGFEVIKDAVSFFIENRDILLKLAKVWLLVKMGGAIGGFVGGGLVRAGQMTKQAGGGLLSAGLDRAGLGTAKFGASLFNLGNMIATRLLPGLGLAALAFEGISKWWKDSAKDRENQKKKIELDKAVGQITEVEAKRRQALLTKAKLGQATGGEIEELTGARSRASQWKKLRGMGVTEESISAMRTPQMEGPALSETARTRLELAQRKLSDTDEELLLSKRALLQFAVEEGLLVKTRQGWEIDSIKIQKDVRDAQGRSIGSWVEVSNALFDLERQIRHSEIDVRSMLGLDKAVVTEESPFRIPEVPVTTATKPRVNVTINRIEVVSDDPDRIAFGLVSAFRDMASNPSGAIDQLRD